MSNINVANVNGCDAEAGKVKAWVNFNGVSTAVVRDSYNVASLIDNGTGNYAVNQSSPMKDANYGITTCGYQDNVVYTLLLTVGEGTPPTPLSHSIYTQQVNTTVLYDCGRGHTAVHGVLA